MTYATLMVHLQLGRTNAALLEAAAELSERFHSGVIGIAGRQPLQMVYGDGYVSGEIYQQDRDDIVLEMKAAETEFRTALQGRVALLEWRPMETFADMSDCIARQARSADLLLTGVESAAFLDASRAVNIGELVMRAGRPVLVAPEAAGSLKLRHVLVGWKDSRETRRAVADALPLLKHALRVSVVEICSEPDSASASVRVKDVAAWLKRHGIKADATTLPSTGDDATGLYAFVQDNQVDMTVAGAYGHSRLREWVLGGVTRDLLLSANRYALLSH